jgi:GNAT superfamily N-acetyltransferase
VRGGLVADLYGRAGQLLGAAGGDPAGEARIAVKAVRSPDDLDRWIEVARAVWGEDADDPPGDLARRQALYAGLGLAPAAALRHWVALAGDRAVGLCSAFYADQDQVLLVDHADVVQAARRRGVGTALVHAALGEAQRRGCRWAVLEPTPWSTAFYDTLGFEVEACRPGVQFYLPLEPPEQAAV